MATAVLGNSHAKTIKWAPNTLATNPIDMQGYYVMRRDWRTEPDTPGGAGPLRLIAVPPEENQDEIDLQPFDTIVLNALGCASASNAMMAKPGNPLTAVACSGWGYDASRVRPEVQLASKAVFEATIEAWVRDNALTRLAFHLAETTPARLFLVPRPAPNRSVLSDPDWTLRRWYGDRTPGVWLDYFRAQHKALQAVAANLGQRAVLVDYPVASALEEGFMDGSFCNPDPFHANSAYGALIVDQIAERMAAA
jgi:hypothetical protein